MRPVSIQMTRFRSHRNTQIDFRGRRRAAITGKKGAGKSSFLNGMFWSLFGKIVPAVDDKHAVMTGERDCLVEYVFEHRSDVVRVTRTFCDTSRPKMTLRLAVQDASAPDGWRDETKKDLDATQAYIYEKLGFTSEIAETLIFLMQGASDKFPRTKPTARRQMLAELAACDHWDAFVARALKKAEAIGVQIATMQEQRAPLTEVAGTLADRQAAADTAHNAKGEANGQMLVAESDLQAANDRLAGLHTEHAAIREARARHTAKAQEVAAAEARVAERRQALQDVEDQIDLLDSTGAGWTTADDAALGAARATEDQATADMDAARARGEVAAESKRQAEKAVEDAGRAIRDANAAAALEWERACNARTMDLKRAESGVLVAQQALNEAGRAVDDARARAREEWQARRAVAAEAVAASERDLSAAQAAVRDAERAIEDARKAAADAWRAAVAVAQADAVRANGSKMLTAGALAGAKRDASLLDGVPCGGRPEFAGCQFLRNAVAQRDALQQLQADADESLAALQSAEAARDALGTEAPPPPPEVLATLQASLAIAQERADAHGQAHASAVMARDALGTEAPAPADEVLLPLQRAHAEARHAVDSAEQAVLAARQTVQALGTVAPSGSPEVLAPLEARQDTARAALAGANRDRDQAVAAYQSAVQALEIARGQKALLEQKRARSEESVRQLAEAQARATALRDEVYRLNQEASRLIGDRDALRAPGQYSRDLDAEIRAGKDAVGTATASRDARVRDVAQAEAQVREAERLVAEAEKAAADLSALDAEIEALRTTEARWTTIARLCVTAQNLIIETILPEASAFTNQMLAELSTTGMSVSYPTQKSVNKGTKLIDRIDIQVTDQKGTRPYESYSGGERFELDWTICLGLLRALGTRTGADIRMMVIDEGFGTHDPDEAARFSNVLNRTTGHLDFVGAITHTPEVYDLFENLLEVKNVAGESSAAWTR